MKIFILSLGLTFVATLVYIRYINKSDVQYEAGIQKLEKGDEEKGYDLLLEAAIKGKMEARNAIIVKSMQQENNTNFELYIFRWHFEDENKDLLLDESFVKIINNKHYVMGLKHFDGIGVPKNKSLGCAMFRFASDGFSANLIRCAELEMTLKEIQISKDLFSELKSNVAHNE